MQNELVILKEDLTSIQDASTSRSSLEELAIDLIEKYSQYDSDLLSEDTISRFINSAKTIMDQKESDWMDKYCTLGDLSDKALYSWKQAFAQAPKYLSKNSIDKLKSLDEKANATLKQRRIETVVHYFKELSDDEKNSCFLEIKKIIGI